MLYSKTGKIYSHDYAYQRIGKLTQIDYAKPVEYYHHPYDGLQHGVKFSDCLDENNWDFLRVDPNATLLHDNNSETFEIHFVHEVAKVVNERKIDSRKITIKVMDENHKSFLEENLKRFDITGINIKVDNYLMNEIVIPEPTEIPSVKKFSSLSRNYRDWRLHVYTEMCRRGNILENFNYSFHNMSPYDEITKYVSQDDMEQDLKKTGFGDLTESVLAWLSKCPHELDTSNNVKNKWSNITYDTIRSADFHLIIETHFDQGYVSTLSEYSRDFSPSSITEKAYKPIACLTPFIAFSTPYWLEDLRKLGFKTFSPYIDESYDLENNNLKRLNMIVDEIQRICQLDKNDYNTLVIRCKEIAQENLQVLKDKKNAR